MTTIRTIKEGLKRFRRKIIRHPIDWLQYPLSAGNLEYALSERYLDEDGHYWYTCVICSRALYSEWCVGGARVKATGEWISFCGYHSKAEIDLAVNMTESQLLDLKYDKPRGN